MKKYYAAYGSNLNLRQMRMRCPTAKKVGSYVLNGYKLEFRCFLTIKKSEGDSVPLGIFKIQEIDEKLLDRYEGYPIHYRKETIKVMVNGKLEDCLVYIMNESIREVTPPDDYYLKICLEGYRNFGFNNNYLRKAYEESFHHE